MTAIGDTSGRLVDLERENRLLRRRLLRSEQSLRLLQEIQRGNSNLLRALMNGIEAEKERADSLLRNILPAAVIQRLSEGETTIADSIDSASVVFSDLVEFTPISASLSALQLVEALNELYSAFDEAAQRIGIEKIKTIGDAYLAVSGLTGDGRHHAEIATEFALAIRDIVIARAGNGGPAWRMRIGLHTGPITAGVIGQHKFAYDIWGDTVNIASRIQDACPPDQVLISAETAESLSNGFTLTDETEVELKGRGRRRVFRVERAPGERPSPAVS